MPNSVHTAYLQRILKVATTDAFEDKELLADIALNAVEWDTHLRSLNLSEEELGHLLTATLAHSLAFSLVEHIIQTKHIPRHSFGKDVAAGLSPTISLSTDLERTVYELLLELEAADPIAYSKVAKTSDPIAIEIVVARSREWAINEAIMGYLQVKKSCENDSSLILCYMVAACLVLQVEGAQACSESMLRVIKTLG